MKHGGNLSGGSLLQHLRTFSSGEKRPEMGHISCLRTKKADAALGPAALPEIRPPGPFRPCKGFSVSLRLAGISMTGRENFDFNERSNFASIKKRPSR